MTAQQVTKGSGYNTNLSYNGLTNRIATPGYGYDANGNLTAMPALTMQYDAQNRMVSSTATSGGTKVYAYGPGGQRVGQSVPPDPVYWQNNMWSIYVYGPDGRRIADCQALYLPVDPQYPQILTFQSRCQTAYVHFRGKLVRKEYLPQLVNGVWVFPAPYMAGKTVGTDRLGSVRYWEYGVAGTTTYYPYGEEQAPTANDTQKFATYTRDSATGLDYAQNRYYASQIGRFTTADPYRRSAKRRNPQSWNRYAYVLNDPVNANDPTGRSVFDGWFRVPEEMSGDAGGGDEGYDGGSVDEGGDAGGPPDIGSGDIPDPSAVLSELTNAGVIATPPVLPPAVLLAASFYGAALVQPLQAAFNAAWNLLNSSECANLFAPPPALAETVPGLSSTDAAQFQLYDTTYRLVPFGPGLSGTGGQTVDPVNVMINTTGALYTAPGVNGMVSVRIPSPNTPGQWTTLSMSATDLGAFILLHELGHQMGIFGEDINSQVNGDHSWEVLENCFGFTRP